MRGWSVNPGRPTPGGFVFPVHAGMVRRRRAASRSSSRVPRACGDGPLLGNLGTGLVLCSPCMRGWSGTRRVVLRCRLVFPVHAGMVRSRSSGSRRCLCVPRACGDGPTVNQDILNEIKCSPCMRGWSATYSATSGPGVVFPVHAGMVRAGNWSSLRLSRVPRACGDGPFLLFSKLLEGQCSPCMRGWSGVYLRRRAISNVFPVHAGMVRARQRQRYAENGVPRACGDGPRILTERAAQKACSPCMRGWSAQRDRIEAWTRVFPVHAGMVRQFLVAAPARPCVPRACGDGPVQAERISLRSMCSPCMRGWSVEGEHRFVLSDVFPVHAGMVRPWWVGSGG